MKVTRRGQVTIPKAIRERTGIDEGTEVEFFEDQGKIVIAKIAPRNPFQDWVGYLNRGGASDEEVQKMRGHDAHSHRH
ncbi:MAG TPA: AbrB/MazE/SpoVT family DNA-binding domain-containing protein [Candidatus Obscuribacterales bacterium]